MRIRALIVSLLLSPAAAAQDGFIETPRGELGVRYWLSSGESKRSHDAQAGSPLVGNPSTVLTYENLDANAVELLGRLNMGRMFLKGNAGIGRINVGSVVEQDFAFGQIPLAQSEASVTGGRLGYFSVDLGREWIFLGRGRTTLGAFIGFGQWAEEVDTFSSETTWSALRVGLAADLLLGPSTRFVADLALVPYAEVRENDNRGVLIEGRGIGLQIDLELRYMLSARTEMRAGVRTWYFDSSDGTRKAGGNSDPLVELVSTRTGLTFSLLRVW